MAECLFVGGDSAAGGGGFFSELFAFGPRWYESQAPLPISADAFTLNMLMRPFALSTLTADSMFANNILNTSGVLMSRTASTAALTDLPVAGVFHTDAGLQVVSPSAGSLNPALAMSRLCIVGLRVDMGAGPAVAELWLNGGVIGSIVPAGVSVVPSTLLTYLGRDPDGPGFENFTVLTGLGGVCSTKRFLSDAEMSENQSAMIQAADISSDALTGGDWEFCWSVKQSIPLGGPPPAVLPNLGTVGVSGDLVLAGTGADMGVRTVAPVHIGGSER